MKKLNPSGRQISEAIFCLFALISFGLAIFIPLTKGKQSIKATAIAMGVFIGLTGLMGFILTGLAIGEKIRQNKAQKKR